jgi:hypothetical protein
VDITVLVLREGRLSISLMEDPLQKAWTFIHGGKDSVRQYHTVNLAWVTYCCPHWKLRL